MRSGLLFIVALVALAGCSASGNGAFKPAIIESAHRACVSSSDCILVQRECGDCDCGKPVNMKFELEYRLEKESRCSSYPGPVCDIWCPTTAAICCYGACVVKDE